MEGSSTGELVALAGEELSRATVIGYGKTTVNADGTAVRQLGLDLAAANLRLALTMGYNDLGTIRSDPRFALLLSRDDLQPQLKERETKNRPGLSAPPQ